MSLLRWLLAPLAPFYWLVVRYRNRFFDQNPSKTAHVSLPVLSIGNLSVGGTGKTPLTLHLAQALNSAGYPNVIISRGYGGRRELDPMDVLPESSPGEVGDEPAMMARRLGANRVVVGRRRLAAALRAISRIPETKLLILDDGFQHRALHRDIDLLLLDGVRVWSNWRNKKLLPLGDLREPMTNAKRAHALVVTRSNHAQKDKFEAWWSKYGSGGPVFYVDFQISALRNLCSVATGGSIEHLERFGIDRHENSNPANFDLSLPNKPGPLFAFCALGNPAAFYADLRVAGLKLLDTRSFRDHQALSPSQIARLASQAITSGAAGLVCTEKDAVKLTPAHLAASELPIWVAEQCVTKAESLIVWIMDSIEGRR